MTDAPGVCSSRCWCALTWRSAVKLQCFIRSGLSLAAAWLLAGTISQRRIDSARRRWSPAGRSTQRDGARTESLGRTHRSLTRASYYELIVTQKHVTVTGLCFTNANGLPFAHDWHLVALSYIVASSGSYAALAMAERLRQKSRTGSTLWQMGSALTLGGSIWSMHLVAMLALHIDLPLTYDVFGTAVSFLVPVASVAVGLTIARRGELSWGRLLAAGAVIGSGVAIMHYLGMASLVFPGSLGYRPALWVLSIIVAIVAAVAALWLALKLHPDWRLRSAAALVMGIAICGMHFTGMAATVFRPDPWASNVQGLQTGPLAIAVAGVTFALLATALVTASADGRLSAQAARLVATEQKSAAERHAAEQERAVLDRDLNRTKQEAELEKHLQGLLATVFRVVSAPVAIITTEGRTVLCNPSFEQLVGRRPGSLLGRPFEHLLISQDRAGFLAKAVVRAANPGQVPGRLFATDLLKGDGSRVAGMVCLSSAPQVELRQFRVVTFVASTEGERPQIASKLRFIRLDDLRALLGEDWEVLASHAMGTAEQVIRRHLSPSDSLRSTADLGFVIAFGSATELQANERCAVMTKDIIDALTGAGEDASTMAMSSVTAALPAEAAPDAVDQSLDSLYDSETPPRRTVVLAGCSLEVVQGCQRGQVVGWFVDADASTVRGASLPPQSSYDELALQGLIGQAEQLDASSREQLCIRASFLCFDTKPATERLLGKLQSLESRLRARLGLILSDVPKSTHVSRVQDAMARLQPFCSTLGIGLSDMDLPSFDLSFLPSPIVTIDSRLLGDTLPTVRLGRLALGLHLKRARLLVRHVGSAKDARLLRAEGVDYITTVASSDAFSL